jgi:hypothetical protein
LTPRAFAPGASLTFGLLLALTPHETIGVEGRVRSLATMVLAGALVWLIWLLSVKRPHLAPGTQSSILKQAGLK